LKGFGV
jgi:hypothetical protein